MLLQKLERKKKLIFYQIISLVALFLILSSLLIFNLFSKIKLIFLNLSEKIDTFCNCLKHLSFSHHPFIFSFFFLLIFLFLIFLFFSLTNFFQLKYKTSLFLKKILFQKKRNSLKVKKIASSLNLENSLIEIKTDIPFIFTFGTFQPKICLSQKLVHQLSSQELKIVLKHEKYHLLQREPQKIFWLKLFKKIFFFIPAFSYLIERYFLLSELSADCYATSNFQEKKYLLKALDKLLLWKEKSFYQKTSFAFFKTTEERIKYLIQTSFSLKTPFLKIGSSFLFLFLVFSLLNFFLFQGEKNLKNFHLQTCQKDPSSFQCLKISPSCQTNNPWKKHLCF